jgi:hypothetical protein
LYDRLWCWRRPDLTVQSVERESIEDCQGEGATVDSRARDTWMIR